MPEHKAPPRRLLGILFGIAVLGIAAWSLLRLDLREMAAGVLAIPPATFAASASLALLGFLCNALRWAALARRSRPADLGFMAGTYLAGVLGNVLSPGARFGGEPVKAFLMRARYGGGLGEHMALILLDKTCNGLSFLCFVVASGAALAFRAIGPLGLALLPLLLLPVAVLLSARLLPRRRVAAGFARLLRPFFESRLGKALFARGGRNPGAALEEALNRYLDPLARLTPPMGGLVLLLSWAYWLLTCASSWLLFRSLGMELDLGGTIVIMTLSTFVSDLGTTPAGLGFVETSMLALFAAAGISGSLAGAGVLANRFVSLAVSLGIGGLASLFLGLRFGFRRREQLGRGEKAGAEE